MPERRKIGEILVQLKAMSRLRRGSRPRSDGEARRRQKFGQTACDMGLLDEEHIFVALAVQMNLFPGVERLSVGQILKYLQTAEAGV